MDKNKGGRPKGSPNKDPLTLSSDEHNAILEQWLAGKRTTETAQAFGVSGAYVRQIVEHARRFGLLTRRGTINEN